jgi:hypothetical protein
MAEDKALVIALKIDIGGWRDGSEAKSTGYSSRGLRFNFQHLHGGSQPSVMGSDALFWPAGLHADRVLIHKINEFFKKDIGVL